MKINRNNYEVFLIDYLDGTLDAALEAELMLFLETHPDIREEMEGLEAVSLESQNIRFAEKNLLKKTEIKTIAGIGEENFEEYFVAFYENDLSKMQQSELDQFLKANPQLEAAFQLHGKLKLQKDESVVYLAKEDLKKKPAIGVWWLSASGVAAAIALLFALFNLIKPNEVDHRTGETAIVQLNSKTVELVLSPNTMVILDRETKAVQLPPQQTIAEPPSTSKFAIASLKTKSISASLLGNEKMESPELSAYDFKTLVIADNNLPKEKKRGALGRVLHRNLTLLAERFPKRNKSTVSDPTFVRILDGGITAFNTVTGSEVEMVKEYDEDGHLKAYQIEGEMLNLNRSIPDSGNAE